jgi:hypothetical protein
MDTFYWILGGTATVVVGLGVLDKRMNKRFDKIDEHLDNQDKLTRSAVDGIWHKLDMIKMHLMNLIESIVGSWKRK